jgi:hypothetical protein
MIAYGTCGVAAPLAYLTIENGGLFTARPQDSLDIIKNIKVHGIWGDWRVGGKFRPSAVPPNLRCPSIAGHGIRTFDILST